MKISVIIPVCNAERYLRQCLGCMLAQTLGAWEAVCVDDGSTDGSLAILAEFAAKDSRFKVISHRYGNAGAARNAGMAEATGEYLGFVDADDLFDPSLFEKACAEGDRTGADVVSIRFNHYNTELERFEAEHFFPKAMLELPRPFAPADLGDGIFSPLAHGPWGRIVRRSLVEREQLRFQEIERMNDVMFCCLALACARGLSLVDEPLYSYRQEHGGNLQSRNGRTPTLAFEVWRDVAGELEKRKLLERHRRALFSAAASKFFYVLGAMPNSRKARLVYRELRRLLDEDPLFSSMREEDIAFPQTQGYFRMFKESGDLAEFLLRQGEYRRKRVEYEKWQGAALWRRLSAAKAKEAQSCSERDNFMAERNQAVAERNALRGEVAGLRADVEAQRRSAAETAAQRDGLLQERDALQGEVAGLRGEIAELRKDIAARKAKEAKIWAERCRFLEERNQAVAERNALRGQVAALNGQVAARDDEIERLRGAGESLRGEIVALNGKVAEGDAALAELRADIKARRAREAKIWAQRCKFFEERNAATRTVGERDREIARLERGVARREDEIARLTDAADRRDAELAALRGSVSYRLGRAATAPVRKIREITKRNGGKKA